MSHLERKFPLSQAHTSSSPAIGLIIRVLLVFDTIALLFAAALHVNGASIPLGSAIFNEPQIVPAAVVEGLVGLIFAGSAYAALARKSWAWSSAIFAHVFAILGFLLGLYATRNGTSPFNFTYHRVMLAIFVAGLILLLLAVGRAALGHLTYESRGISA
jgi:hypothetical protein